MRGGIFVSIFLIPLLFISVSYANKSSEVFKVVTPLPNSIYDEAYASIVIERLDKALGRVTLLFDDNSTKIIKTDQKRDIYCLSVRLKYGNNKITILGYDASEKLTKKELNLFYRSEVYEGSVDAPDSYKKNFFHTLSRERVCSSCHNMKKDRKSDQEKILYDPMKSNCYECHKNIAFRKNGHAPTVNFLCVECHTGRTSEHNIQDEGKSRFLAPDPILNRCFSCHEGIGEKWFSNRSEHGPLRSGRCNKCHNPHSSEYEFFLRKPIWKLCTTCHDEKADGEHIIGSFVFVRNKGGHPTRDRPDPARPGRELVCSGCHNPHGSNGVYLLRSDGKSPFSVCIRCHKKY